MKTLGTLCVSFVLCVLGAGNASAQMFSRHAPGLSGLWHPTVGAGAFYEVDKPGEPKQPFNFAIVGKETAQGQDAVWIEMTLSTERMGTMLVKELVSFDPVKKHMQNFKAIVQMPGRPPMLMPDEMMNSRQGFDFKDARDDSVDLGSQSVTTPAGTFPCEHYRQKDGSSEFWVSEKVVPIGLVKSVDKDGQTTTLVKTVTDAKDQITGTPQPFNPMMFMSPQSQQ
jgi:hypothetical protein